MTEILIFIEVIAGLIVIVYFARPYIMNNGTVLKHLKRRIDDNNFSHTVDFHIKTTDPKVAAKFESSIALLLAEINQEK
jgi:hypothetical protein